jgi:hypothetical protein
VGNFYYLGSCSDFLFKKIRWFSPQFCESPNIDLEWCWLVIDFYEEPMDLVLKIKKMGLVPIPKKEPWV